MHAEQNIEPMIRPNPSTSARSNAGGRKSLPRMLAVMNAPTEDFGFADAVTWDAVPALAQYEVIVLQVPAAAQIVNDFEADIRVALAAGATVVWLIDAGAAEEAVAAVTRTVVSKLRTPIPTDGAIVFDRRFEPLLRRAGSYAAFFEGDDELQPIAHGATPTMMIAAQRMSGHGREIILPGSVTSGSALLLAQLARRIHRLSPEVRHLLDTAAALLLFALIVLGVHLLRLATIRANLAATELDTSIFSQPPPLFMIDVDVPSLAEAIKDPKAMGSCLSCVTAAATFGMVSDEIALAKMLDPDDQRKYYRDDVLPAAEVALRDERYEDARFAAQRFLNTMTKFTGQDALLANYDLDYARKVTRLVGSNFLYSDSEAVRAIVEAFDRRAKAKLPDSVIHPSLRDDLEYARTALAASVLPYAQRIELWREFAGYFGDSPLAEDAHFNQITAQLNSHRYAVSPSHWFILNIEALGMIDSFLATSERSQLGDDALLYRLRVAISLGATSEAWETLRRLASRAPIPDALVRLRFQLAEVASQEFDLEQFESELAAAIVIRAAAGPRTATIADLAPTAYADASRTVGYGKDERDAALARQRAEFVMKSVDATALTTADSYAETAGATLLTQLVRRISACGPCTLPPPLP